MAIGALCASGWDRYTCKRLEPLIIMIIVSYYHHDHCYHYHNYYYYYYYYYHNRNSKRRRPLFATQSDGGRYLLSAHVSDFLFSGCMHKSLKRAPQPQLRAVEAAIRNSKRRRPLISTQPFQRGRGCFRMWVLPFLVWLQILIFEV